MHELALADAILTIARNHAKGRRVTSVEVKVGRLRQVVPDALAFAFGLVAAGTDADGATLEVEHVPAVVSCRRCRAETEADGLPLACAACGGIDVTVVSGDELLVESLELEDEPAGNGRQSTLVRGR